MEHMIEQQIIALDMEALTNRMKRLELEDKVITLLNQLWDDNYLKSSTRRTVKVNWEDDCMEVFAGELRASTFYFMNETRLLFAPGLCCTCLGSDGSCCIHWGSQEPDHLYPKIG